MHKKFTPVEKRAKSSEFFLMWAYELKTIRPISNEFTEGKLKKDKPLSVFEVEYKNLMDRIFKALIAAQRGGLNCTSITIDEELSEELIKHLHHIGYFVVSGPIVDGTIKILINW